jgi:ribosomal protein S27AE
MTKRHHYNRKGQPQKRCNPDTCPNCMYIGEGDSWCDKLVKLFFLTGSLRIITWGVVRGQEQMKAHIEPKSKECPFCGASTYEL